MEAGEIINFILFIIYIMTLTCVSGYWIIKSKVNNNKYNEWFSNSLKVNCPYVFFSDKETIETIKKYRNNLPTYYVECNIEDFYVYKYRNKMITDKSHCPSVELNLIWHEKIFLLQKAYKLNPFNSEYFKWIDAGHCIYRNKRPQITPFPNITKLNNLPKDKFIYSSSMHYNENVLKSKDPSYHHISGTYILHKNIIDKFVEIYKQYLDKLVNTDSIWTDQILLTHIYKDNKELFFKLCHGYGKITEYLSE